MTIFTILGYDFFLRALLAGASLALVSPLVGLLVVVRRQSLIADTLAHGALAGVALGGLLGLNVTVSSFIFTIIAAIGIEWLRRSSRAPADANLSLFLSASLAIALIAFHLRPGGQAALSSALFGGILTISNFELITLFSAAVIIALTLIITWKEQFLLALDENLARAQGLKAGIYQGIFSIAVALMVAIGIKAVGVLLVGAIMIIPVLAANEWRLGFSKTALVGIAFAALSTTIGLFAAFFLDLPASAAIIIASLIVYALSRLVNAS